MTFLSDAAVNNQDDYFMERALSLARGVGARSRPNPRVGAVLVQGDKIIGEGATQAAGSDHAEIVALKNARAQGHDAQGATAYVTLEPCAHFGRTPPCVDALIAAQVARVVVATRDPYPKVAGAGISALLNAGIKVDEGVGEIAARAINAGFFSRIERQKPWCRLKIAASLDGVTALHNGQSQWISNATSRRDAHQWRAQSCALLTGIGTILADDPQLTVRNATMSIAPERIVIDSQARIPLDAKILQNTSIHIFCAIENSRTDALRQAGHQVWLCRTNGQWGNTSDEFASVDTMTTEAVDLHAVMRQLARLEYNEVLIEAGASLSAALLKAGLVDEVLCYLAPKILGQGRGWVNWQIDQLSQGIALELIESVVMEGDLRLRFLCRSN